MASNETLSIVIVGGGNLGTSVGKRMHEVGHTVNFAGRNPVSEKMLKALAEVDGSVCHELPDAATNADMLLVAVPFAAVIPTLEAIGDIGDAVVVDATNPVLQGLGERYTSGLDVIAEVLPDATLVKAFDTIGAETAQRPVIDGRGIFLPIAGDPDGAEMVRRVAEQMGFDARVIGGRKQAHFLEEFAWLCIHMAVKVKVGADFGFAVMKR